MVDLTHYKIKAADWRVQIRKNSARTRNVIILFILLYVGLGFLIDIIIYDNIYHAPVAAIFHALLRLDLFPYATVTMAVAAAISLFITYTLYDKIMLLGTEYYQLTDSNGRTLQEQQLYHVIEEMKVAAGLRFMPKIFIIEADYMNAFASGYSEKSAMVAITRGLMQKLDRAEMQAVMAHELSHIRHQDIKLTLTASVLSSIILIGIDLIFYNLIYGRDRKSDARLVIIVVLLRYLLPIITSILLLYLSRTREYMADAGCVELMRDNQPLARALIKIQDDYLQNRDHYQDEYRSTAHEEVRRAAYLYDPMSVDADPTKSIFNLFSTHPSLKKRLKAIGIDEASS